MTEHNASLTNQAERAVQQLIDEYATVEGGPSGSPQEPTLAHYIATGLAQRGWALVRAEGIEHGARLEQCGVRWVNTPECLSDWETDDRPTHKPGCYLHPLYRVVSDE